MMNWFRGDLIKQDWHKVFSKGEDGACETFCQQHLLLLDHIYDEKSWLTVGMLDSCKQIYLLYKAF